MDSDVDDSLGFKYAKRNIQFTVTRLSLTWMGWDLSYREIMRFIAIHFSENCLQCKLWRLKIIAINQPNLSNMCLCNLRSAVS